MNEQSKAAKRRFSDGAFHVRYFVGDGIDIGGKPDPLGQYANVFARMGAFGYGTWRTAMLRKWLVSSMGPWISFIRAIAWITWWMSGRR
jgi:hypothetical protein